MFYVFTFGASIVDAQSPVSQHKYYIFYIYISTTMTSYDYEKATKALLKYYLLKRQARKQVFQNKCGQIIKIFKWRRNYRLQLIREKYNCEQEEDDEGGVGDCGGPSSLTDIDIVRKNLWLMIARKEVILAQRRRSYYREQKISRARAVADRCRAYHIDAKLRKRKSPAPEAAPIKHAATSSSTGGGGGAGCNNVVLAE